MKNRKTGEGIHGFLPFQIKLVNNGAARVLSAPVDQLLQDRFLALRNNLYLAGGQVPNRSGKPQFIRLPLRIEPEIDALYNTGDNYGDSFIRHFCCIAAFCIIID